MRQDIEELRLTREIDEVQIAFNKYRLISPRVEFGEGGSAMQAQLSDLEQMNPEVTKDPCYSRMSGWVSLELAAHLPIGAGRNRHLEIAKHRLETAASYTKSGSSQKRLNGYVAKLGLAATFAYENPIEMAIESNAGYYCDLLNEVRNDEGVKLHMVKERRGLLSELTAATLISHCGYLVLPASLRHDQPLSKERPSVAYDLQVWLDAPAALPDRPDRKVQVKTRRSKEDEKYCNSLTLLSLAEDFVEAEPEQLADVLARLYGGLTVNSQGTRCLEQNSEEVKSILRREVGEKQQAQFASNQMPSQHKYQRQALRQRSQSIA